MATVSLSNSGFSSLYLDDLFNVAECQFTHEKNGNSKNFLTRFLGVLREMAHVQCLIYVRHIASNLLNGHSLSS